ncbi:hypothetical protein NP493_2100g00002 [Ridgeia piscesae]|uniref:Uncharacterized protein n=1 Tax=Ridgeia piscesae TaxID=27915 RepID=A0AAD9JLA8_RIDPI|nr:hypothetical protein NP493_2100g00002 [Ridgeia piscesae]
MNVAVAAKGTSLFRLVGSWFKEQANYSYQQNTCKAGTKCENYMMCPVTKRIRPYATCSTGDTVLGVLHPETCSCSCTYGAGPNCDRECKNPHQYLDYDICAGVTPDECEHDDPNIRSMLAEFCPEQCVCRM